MQWRFIARKMAVSAICITSLLMQGPNAALSESTNAMLPQYAEKMGHDPDGLEFLHVANFRPFARKYRVDLKRKVLVEDETHFKSKKKKIKKKEARSK
jgi:hypothetical protein